MAAADLGFARFNTEDLVDGATMGTVLVVNPLA